MIYTLKENEVFCCEKGCGVCNVFEIWDEYSTEISPCGNYKRSEAQRVQLSRCCEASVFVWNTVKDEEVEIDH